MNLESIKNIVVFQSLSCVWLFAMPWIAAHQASPSFTISQGLLKLMSIVSIMPSNNLILCCPPFFNLSQPGSILFSYSKPLSRWLSSLQQQSYLSSLLLHFNPVSPPPHPHPPHPVSQDKQPYKIPSELTTLSHKFKYLQSSFNFLTEIFCLKKGTENFKLSHDSIQSLLPKRV